MENFDKQNDNFFTRNPSFVTGFFALILVSAFVFNTCFVYIKPNEYGIKKINIGANKGIREKVYDTGLHLVLPLSFQEMHHFPKNVQVLEMTNRLPSRNRGKRVFQNAVRIQTSDGFFVDVDVSIFYRIQDPYKVITTIGPGDRFIRQGILPKAEPVLKEALGTLTTEDFYNSPLRVQKVELAQRLLQSELEPKGLTIDHILLRYFHYTDEIQRNIEDKKLKDQAAFKNQSESRAAEQRNKLRKVRQEGKAKILVRLQEGKAYVQKKNADKDLYMRQTRAEANLLINLAKAEKDKMMNEAFKSPGIDRRVGLEMAKTLQGLEIIILPSAGQDGLNPLDLDRVVKMFGVENGQ